MDVAICVPSALPPGEVGHLLAPFGAQYILRMLRYVLWLSFVLPHGELQQVSETKPPRVLLTSRQSLEQV